MEGKGGRKLLTLLKGSFIWERRIRRRVVYEVLSRSRGKGQGDTRTERKDHMRKGKRRGSDGNLDLKVFSALDFTPTKEGFHGKMEATWAVKKKRGE